MKLMLLFVLFTSALCAQLNPCGDFDCGQGSCQPCHYQSHFCGPNSNGCAPCDENCANLSATLAKMSPAQIRAYKTNQVIAFLANPVALTDAGKLWQQASHTLLPSLARVPGAHLPAGHPPIAKTVSLTSRCLIFQQAQLFRGVR